MSSPSPEAPILDTTPEKDPKEVVFEKLAAAKEAARAARNEGRRLKEEITLQNVFEIPHGTTFEKVHGAVNKNAGFFKSLIDHNTIVESDKKGLYKDHIVVGQYLSDPNIRISYVTSRFNQHGFVWETRFSAKAIIDVKAPGRSWRLPLASLFR